MILIFLKIQLKIQNKDKELSDKLKELNLEELNSESLSKMSRSQVLTLAHKLEGIQFHLSENNLNVSYNPILSSGQSFLKSVVVELNENYIPFSWHERSDDIEEPSWERGTHGTEKHHIKNKRTYSDYIKPNNLKSEESLRLEVLNLFTEN